MSLQKQIIHFLSIPPQAGQEEGFSTQNEDDLKRTTEDSIQAEQYATEVQNILNSAYTFQGIREKITTVLAELTSATILSQIIMKSSLLEYYKNDVGNKVNILDISYGLAQTAASKASEFAEFPISMQIKYDEQYSATNSTQWSEPANKATTAKENATLWLEQIRLRTVTGKEVLEYAQDSAIEGRNIKEAAPLTASDDTIQKQNDEIDATFSTKYTQILYQEERNKTAKLVVYWVNIAYYILAGIFVYFLIYSEKTATTNWKYKLLYTIIIVAFPFVIVPIELFLKQVLQMLYLTTLGKPYEPSKWKVMGEPEYMKKPAGYGIATEPSV